MGCDKSHFVTKYSLNGSAVGFACGSLSSAIVNYCLLLTLLSQIFGIATDMAAARKLNNNEAKFVSTMELKSVDLQGMQTKFRDFLPRRVNLPEALGKVTELSWRIGNSTTKFARHPGKVRKITCREDWATYELENCNSIVELQQNQTFSICCSDVCDKKEQNWISITDCIT